MTDSVQPQQHVVGPWLLERRLGVGGMAEVWLARHTRLETQAAVKFLNTSYAGHPEVEARFLDEGKLQARLTQLNAHGANILPVFDYMSVDGRSYLIMRYIQGFGLDHRIANARGPLPTAEVLSISRDVLGAMGFAHSQGVIHRDIKPSNVLLEGGKRAFLMDFGIALARDAEVRRTRVGSVLGTMHYMSPEQIESPRDVTPASDIYSFGCMLFEMLTGQTPFDPQSKATDLNIMRMHVAEPPPPPSRFNPAVPRDLEEVVLRCLAKRAVDRFPDCETVQSWLDGRRPAGSPSVSKATVIDATGSLVETRVETALPRTEGQPPKSAQPSSPAKPRPSTSPAKRPGALPMEELRRQQQKKRTLSILVAAFAVAVALSAGIAFWPHKKPEPAPVQQTAAVQPPTDPGTGAQSSGLTAHNPGGQTAKKPTTRPSVIPGGQTGTMPTAGQNPPTNPAPVPVQLPRPDSTVPTSGTMVWMGSVTPGQPIAFYPGGRVSAGKVLQGTGFPAQPATIDIRPAAMFAILQQPSAANNWMLILNPRASGDMKVTLHWSLAGQ